MLQRSPRHDDISHRSIPGHRCWHISWKQQSLSDIKPLWLTVDLQEDTQEGGSQTVMLAVAEDEEMGGSMQLAAADAVEEEDVPRPEVVQCFALYPQNCWQS